MSDNSLSLVQLFLLKLFICKPKCAASFLRNWNELLYMMCMRQDWINYSFCSIPIVIIPWKFNYNNCNYFSWKYKITITITFHNRPIDIFHSFALPNFFIYQQAFQHILNFKIRD